MTDTILKELVESIKNDLFPKRAIVPYRSPAKIQDPIEDFLLVKSDPAFKIKPPEILSDHIIEEENCEDS